MHQDGHGRYRRAEVPIRSPPGKGAMRLMSGNTVACYDRWYGRSRGAGRTAVSCTSKGSASAGCQPHRAPSEQVALQHSSDCIATRGEPPTPKHLIPAATTELE